MQKNRSGLFAAVVLGCLTISPVLAKHGGGGGSSGRGSGGLLSDSFGLGSFGGFGGGGNGLRIESRGDGDSGRTRIRTPFFRFEKRNRVSDDRSLSNPPQNAAGVTGQTGTNGALGAIGSNTPNLTGNPPNLTGNPNVITPDSILSKAGAPGEIPPQNSLGGRRDALLKEIGQGMAQGSITSDEAHALLSHEANIAQSEKNFRHDGLTSSESQTLSAELDALARVIDQAKSGAR